MREEGAGRRGENSRLRWFDSREKSISSIEGD